MEPLKLPTELTFLYRSKYKKAKLATLIFGDYLDPYMVFSDFFSASDIKGHLAELKKMYRCAISLRRIKSSPANAIYDRELFSNVLNAAWVIDQTGIRFFQVANKEHYAGMSGGKLNDQKITHYLTDVEIKDPYLGIKNVFKKATLNECQAALYEWLKLAFCKCEFDEDVKGGKRYKYIVKTLICCWLIYEKEILGFERLPATDNEVKN